MLSAGPVNDERSLTAEEQAEAEEIAERVRAKRA